jgi:uncharacterized repeat protein (TIGR01451 family)
MKMKIPQRTALIVVVCSTLLTAGSAFAQFTQQGPKLVAASFNASQGSAVAVSADGNTAVIGGPSDNEYIGGVWIWTRSAGVWSLQAGKLVGSGTGCCGQQGTSVAISADGNTVLVGGAGDDYSDGGAVGAAWVWTRTAGVWSEQAKLIGTGASGQAFQGESVALSADGNTALIGGQHDNSNVGAAWVFTRSGGVWTQQGAKLTGSGVPRSQGSSVSLSSDGNSAMVGGYSLFESAAAWIWTRSGGVWTQQGPALVGSGGVDPASAGSLVSISSDGNTGAVGGYTDNNNAGAVWIWTRSGGVWTQQGTKLVSPESTNAQQGRGLSLSGDGNILLVGGPNDLAHIGGVWFWTRSAGVWSQRGSKIVGSGATGNAFQGGSVSLSTDGDTALVGGQFDTNSHGAVWVFVAAPDLIITKSHTGTFKQGDHGDTYTITVSNLGLKPTSGTVTVTDTVPDGLTPTAPTGSFDGWTCSINGQVVTCTQNDVLDSGASYAPITLTVNVANDAPPSVTNTATVSGGGELKTDNDSASDVTPIHAEFVPVTPTGVAATAVTATQININWLAVNGAASYEIDRKAAGGGFSQIGTSTTNSISDTTPSADSAYLYRIRAVNEAGKSSNSASDLATTVIFADDPLPLHTLVKAVHLSELRTAINAVRLLAGLSAFSFTDTGAAGTTIRAVHLTELRSSLDEARAPLGLATGGYTDASPAGGAIKTVHFQELRSRVQ